MKIRNKPIGIFDSGIGGLTVANAICRELPNERIIYFGDTAHLPYGDKSADAIRYYSIKIGKYLIDQGCKLIVIACNSASSAAYDLLIEFFEGKAIFINVVDPLVHKASSGKFNHIGVIGTKATVDSKIYNRKLKEVNQSVKITSLATPLLAPMIEEGFHDNKISEAVIEEYLEQDSLKDIESLLLACTHYPLIKRKILDYYQKQDKVVSIYDSTDVVGAVVKSRLEEMDMLSKKIESPHRFCVSDYTASFESTTKIFFNKAVQLEHCNIW